MAETREAKRPRLEDTRTFDCFFVPDIDCTRDNFFSRPDLNDRQRLCWALRTEERVRFGKLIGRSDFSRYPSSFQSCPYLIDLYPRNSEDEGNEAEGANDFGVHAEDWRDYQRRAIPNVTILREMDESMQSCKLDVGPRHRMNEFHVNHDVADGGNKNIAVPPNLLFFRIILEGFMGYHQLCDIPNDGFDQPRWSVMGGAVVASLTAWRTAKIKQWFVDFERNVLLMESPGAYSRHREELVHRINKHFMYETDEGGRAAHGNSNSPMFSDSDVDVFLQASPLTMKVQDQITSLPREVLDNIGEFIGGCGFVSNDLQRFSQILCPKLVKVLDYCLHTYVYSLTRNGLSFMLALHFEGEHDSRIDWPRSTQIIMMKEQADLVGGLMDFDISLPTCAFDGTGVFLTPRAMISLQTSTQIVTPFILQERRNRQRIIKYFRRGFVPYLLDPNCSHYRPCRPSMEERLHDQRTDDEIAGSVEEPLWRAVQLHPGYNRDFPEELVQSCCYASPLSEGMWPVDRHKRAHSAPYSLYLFEKKTDHAMHFFSNHFGWAADELELVQSYPVEARVSCARCREFYATTLFVEKGSSFLEPSETGDDVVHGDYTYHKSTGASFSPSFYNGGTFDSKRVGWNARSLYSQLAALRAQCLAEEARHAAAREKAVTTEPYRGRFIYGENLDTLFRTMQVYNFAPNKRRPVGLNPERFMGVCESCQAWLHQCEYGTRYCLECSKKQT